MSADSPVTRTAGSTAAENTELIHALAGLDANAGLAIAQRTRRVVREETNLIREDHKRRRRNKGLALLMAMALITLLTPALWSEVDGFFAGEHLTDLTTMFTLLALMLFSAVIAALIASWKDHQPLRYGRRNF
jgi:hypothetical protein